MTRVQKPVSSTADAAYQAGAACAIVALASLFDVWATWVAIRLGFPEANPLFAPILNTPGGEAALAQVAGLKAVGLIALTYGTWRLVRAGRHVRPLLWVLRILAYTHVALALYHAAGIALTIAR